MSAWEKHIPAQFEGGISRARFMARASEIADSVGIPVDWLYAVMYNESRFNPKARFRANGSYINPKTGLYYTAGLIQWVNSTAVELHGLTTNQIYNLDAEKQLSLAYTYFKKKGVIGRMNSITDVFLAVFYPAAVGKPLDTVILASPSTGYVNNSAFDKDTVKGGNNDGKITVREIDTRYKFFIRQVLGEDGLQEVIKATVKKNWLWYLAGGLVVAGGGYYAFNRFAK